MTELEQKVPHFLNEESGSRGAKGPRYRRGRPRNSVVPMQQNNLRLLLPKQSSHAPKSPPALLISAVDKPDGEPVAPSLHGNQHQQLGTAIRYTAKDSQGSAAIRSKETVKIVLLSFYQPYAEITFNAVVNPRYPQSFISKSLVNALSCKVIPSQHPHTWLTPQGRIRSTCVVDLWFRLPPSDTSWQLIRVLVTDNNAQTPGEYLIIGRPWMEAGLVRSTAGNDEIASGDLTSQPSSLGSGKGTSTLSPKSRASPLEDLDDTAGETPLQSPASGQSDDSVTLAESVPTSRGSHTPSSQGGEFLTDDLDESTSTSEFTDDELSEIDDEDVSSACLVALQRHQFFRWMKDVIVARIKNNLLIAEAARLPEQSSFRQHGQQQETGSGESSSTPSQSSHNSQETATGPTSKGTTGSQQQGTGGGRRNNPRRQDQQDSHDSDPEQDMPCPNSTQPEIASFACPFSKRYPHNGRLAQMKCHEKHWFTYRQVKEHVVTRRHCRLILRCPRCFEVSPSKQTLEEHIRAQGGDQCHVRSPPPKPDLLRVVDESQEKRLKQRPRRLTDKERWIRMYRILFPEVPLEQVPSPYTRVNYSRLFKSMGTVEECCKQISEELAPRVSGEVHGFVQSQPRLLNRLPDLPGIIQNAIRDGLLEMLPRLIESHTSQGQTAAASTATGTSISALAVETRDPVSGSNPVDISFSFNPGLETALMPTEIFNSLGHSTITLPPTPYVGVEYHDSNPFNTAPFSLPGFGRASEDFITESFNPAGTQLGQLDTIQPYIADYSMLNADMGIFRNLAGTYQFAGRDAGNGLGYSTGQGTAENAGSSFQHTEDWFQGT